MSLTVDAALAAFHSLILSPEEVVQAQLGDATKVQLAGNPVFIALDPEKVRGMASDSARRYREGTPLPLDGVSVSIKDLFDVRGEVTSAGSRVLSGQPPAVADALCVASLRRAGAVLFGRTNMVEFAYSGLGLNSHWGSPINPWSGDGTARVAGGSSSGAAVAVAMGLVCASLGSDTGGSIRVPAALCGVTGFKPSSARVPVAGSIPMAMTLDSVGVIANSVECCMRLDAVLAISSSPAHLGEHPRVLSPLPAWSGLDPAVRTACQVALEALRETGVRVEEMELPELDEFFAIGLGHYRRIASFEAFHWHRTHVKAPQSDYDPRVFARIAEGERVSGEAYVESLTYRRLWTDRMRAALAPYAAVVLPTVTCLAPSLDEAATDEGYRLWGSKMPRNVAWVNLMGGCGLTIPCQARGKPPVGFQLVGVGHQDATILVLGQRLEHGLRSIRND